ncbi:hypothetical protein GGF46_000790 [Coemansia sp. RSA 552]|nr:hypothetical protein GGF46_000790 [Coemansia sp. RSA 552]
MRRSTAGDSDSSDDFVPSTVRKRQPARSRDDLEDVVAFAQCNGTLSSFREQRRRMPRRRRRGSDGGSASGSGSEAESFYNIILLEGPSGACKTAAIYACASECGFEVCEIHPGQRRSGRDVLAALEDAIQSHTISRPAGSVLGPSTPAVSQMLVLIEHIDILFEQDQRLWPALKQLALKSRRPIVLTCNDMTSIRWDTSCFYSVLHFERPSEHALVPYCFLLCLAEGILASPTDIARICADAHCDINRVLNRLELAICMSDRTDMPAAAPAASATGTPEQPINLSGTLAWLLGDAGPEETLQTCYQVWSEMVASSQSSGNGEWFICWPDLPLVPLPSTDCSRPPTNQNAYFGSKSHPPASTASLETADMQDPLLALQAKGPVVRPVVPLVLSRPCTTASYGSESLSDLDQLDQLDAIASAFDTLSLSARTSVLDQARDECHYEPLYSFTSPLLDGCLGVTYIVIDPDVSMRNNPQMQLDSFGTEYVTGASIRTSLEADSAEKLLSQPKAGSDAALALWNPARPTFTSTQSARQTAALPAFREAAVFAGAQSQQMPCPKTADAVGYLADMVRWDWIHQGKLRALGPVDTTGDEDEHIYRPGARRTRQRTYRAHVKFMPPQMQDYLVSWLQR